MSKNDDNLAGLSATGATVLLIAVHSIFSLFAQGEYIITTGEYIFIVGEHIFADVKLTKIRLFSKFLSQIIRKESGSNPITGLCYPIFPSDKYLEIVLRWTPITLAMADFVIFISSRRFTSDSRPVSLFTFDLLPFGLPSKTPSAFFRANASFVRCEIRLRSISADNPKAKARTFDVISLPKR